MGASLQELRKKRRVTWPAWRSSSREDSGRALALAAAMRATRVVVNCILGEAMGSSDLAN